MATAGGQHQEIYRVQPAIAPVPEALRRTVEICREIELPVLSVYAFSTENWLRPMEEVRFLMRLFIEYLHNEVALMNRQNIRLGFLGDKEGLARPSAAGFGRGSGGYCS